MYNHKIFVLCVSHWMKSQTEKHTTQCSYTSSFIFICTIIIYIYFLNFYYWQKRINLFACCVIFFSLFSLLRLNVFYLILLLYRWIKKNNHIEIIFHFIMLWQWLLVYNNALYLCIRIAYVFLSLFYFMCVVYSLW